MKKKRLITTMLVISIITLTLFQPLVSSSSLGLQNIISSIQAFYGAQDEIMGGVNPYVATSDSNLETDIVQYMCESAAAAELDSVGTIAFNDINVLNGEDGDYIIEINYTAQDVEEITFFAYDITAQIESQDFTEVTPVSYINQIKNLNETTKSFKLKAGTHTDTTLENGYNSDSVIVVKMGGINVTKPASQIVYFAEDAEETVVTVTNGGVVTEYNSLKGAVDYANTIASTTAADTVIEIIKDTSITESIMFSKSMTIISAKDVTVKLENSLGNSMYTGENGIDVVIGDATNKITFDGSDIAFNARAIESGKSKGKITVKNVAIQNFETSSNQGVFASKSSGTLVIDTVAFINCKSTDATKPYVIFIGTDATLKGNVTFSDCSSTNIYLEKSKNIKISGLDNAVGEMITIEHQDPSVSTNAVAVLRFSDQAQADKSFANFVLVNNGYKFESASKAYEFNIVLDSEAETPAPATATPTADPTATATPTPAPTIEPGSAIASVSQAGGEVIDYKTLKEAVGGANALDATTGDIVVTILKDCSITETLTVEKSMTINSALDVTVKLEMSTGSAIQTAATDINVVIGGANKITFDGAGASFEHRVIEAATNKAKVTVQNVAIQNFETSSTQGALVAKGGGTLVIDTVAFKNVKATNPEKPYVIFDGTDLTIKGNVTFTDCSSTNIYLEKTKNVKVSGLTNEFGEIITIEHQDPSISTNAVAVLRFEDQAQADQSFANFVLINDGYKFEPASKAYEFNIVLDSGTVPTATPEPVTVAKVTTAGVTTEHTSLKEAVEYANTLTESTDTVIELVNDVVPMTGGIRFTMPMTVTANEPVTISASESAVFSFVLESEGVVTFDGRDSNYITVAGDKVAYNASIFDVTGSTSVKSTCVLNNIKIKDFVSSGRGTVVSKTKGAVILENVAFENCKSSEDASNSCVVFNGYELTIKGNVTFTDCADSNIYSEDKNIKVASLTNTDSDKIAIEYKLKDKETTEKYGALLRFTNLDVAEAEATIGIFNLVNDGYEFKAGEKDAYNYDVVKISGSIPTAPPTEVPPTATPTAAPPTAPPTEAPPTEAPPTEAPPTAPPTAIPTAIPTATPSATPTPEFNYTVNNITQAGSGIDVSITKNAEATGNIVLIIAGYNSDGIMVSIKIDASSVSSMNIGDTKVVSISNAELDLSKAAKVSAYIWALDNITPLSEVMSVNKKNILK